VGHLRYRQMDERTRPIVRLEVMNRMVTKGYRKGVYKWCYQGNWQIGKGLATRSGYGGT